MYTQHALVATLPHVNERKCVSMATTAIWSKQSRNWETGQEEFKVRFSSQHFVCNHRAAEQTSQHGCHGDTDDSQRARLEMKNPTAKTSKASFDRSFNFLGNFPPKMTNVISVLKSKIHCE